MGARYLTTVPLRHSLAEKRHALAHADDLSHGWYGLLLYRLCVSLFLCGAAVDLPDREFRGERQLSGVLRLAPRLFPGHDPGHALALLWPAAGSAILCYDRTLSHLYQCLFEGIVLSAGSQARL